MRYVSGRDEKGRPIKVDDPLAAQFSAIANSHRDDPRGLAHELLGIRAIFGDDLPRDPSFVQPVSDWLAKLHTSGAARTVDEAVGPR
jgi:fructuronate reductase